MNKNTILSPQRHDDTASNIQRQTCNQSPLWLISMIHNGINNRGNGDHRKIPDHSAKPLRSSASSVVNIYEQHSLRSWLFCGSIVVHNLANCGRCWWPGCERLPPAKPVAIWRMVLRNLRVNRRKDYLEVLIRQFLIHWQCCILHTAINEPFWYTLYL